MSIKIKNLSSIFKLTKNQFNRENKIEFLTTKVSLTKKNILGILKSASGVVPKSINTLIVKKSKFGRSGSLKSNEKYLNISYFKKVVSHKKIIVTFEHSRGKVKFLNDFGIN